MPPTLCLQVLDHFSDSCTAYFSPRVSPRVGCFGAWMGAGVGDGQCAKRILGSFSSSGGNLSSHLHGKPKGRRVGLGQKDSMCSWLELLRLILVRAPPLVVGPSYSLNNFLKVLTMKMFQHAHTYTHTEFDLAPPLLFP